MVRVCLGGNTNTEQLFVNAPGNRSINHMPIQISFAPSRSKKVTVDVVPATWQTYIEH